MAPKPAGDTHPATPGGGFVNKAVLDIYEIMEGTAAHKRVVAFHAFIVVLITLNVLFVVIETEESIAAKYGEFFLVFETFSLTIFAGEYALRLIVSRLHPNHSGKRFALLRLVVSPMMLVDLAVILPFFLPFIVADTRAIRILRLLRLFSIFKIARFSTSMKTFGEVIRSKAADLLMGFFILFIVLVLSSSLMYYAERDAQPEVFTSIIATMWWGVVTLTTIGYGDVVPITPAGRVIGAAVAGLGIAVYAIPTGIMASAFNEFRRRRKSGRFCPHCGESLD